MRYAHTINNTINKIIDVYDANAKTKSRKRALLLHKMALISEMLLICGFIAYMGCAIIHLINPIYAYFWRNEFQALFPLYIPFIDEKTPGGFILLILIQTVEIFISAAAIASADFAFAIIIANLWIFSTIFENNVSELDKILHEKKVDMTLAKAQLKNIVEMYNDICM